MNTYKEFVDSLAKDPGAVKASLTPNKCALLHVALGLSSEVGEVVSLIKRHIMYELPLDMAHMREELGDLKYFFIYALSVLGFTEEEIEAANKAKLLLRYPNGAFSNADAVIRRDKSKDGSYSLVQNEDDAPVSCYRELGEGDVIAEEDEVTFANNTGAGHINAESDVSSKASIGAVWKPAGSFVGNTIGKSTNVRARRRISVQPIGPCTLLKNPIVVQRVGSEVTLSFTKGENETMDS